jgi:hypothetical protein
MDHKQTVPRGLRAAITPRSPAASFAAEMMLMFIEVVNNL